jgi:predicted metal-binding protein
MGQTVEETPHASEAGNYIVVVQCHIVKERCSGYHCEKAFHERSGYFESYADRAGTRMLTLTCGGCCGRALLRKLSHLTRRSKKKENFEKNRFIVKFASCVALGNYHGPVCPHLDYLKSLVRRAGLPFEDGTVLSPTAQRRRDQGCYDGSDGLDTERLPG